MTQNSTYYSHRHYDGLLSAISIGFFLILIGGLFVTTSGLATNVVNFLSHFKVVPIPNTNANIPSPDNLAAYLDVYTAARQFSLIWGVFLIAMLGARFILNSPLRRKAQNVGDIAFWLGATYAIQVFLVVPTQQLTITVTDWVVFWAAIVMIIGISLIARAIFLAIAAERRA